MLTQGDASYTASRGWSLNQLDQLRNKLSFRNLYSGHYSSLIKILLARWAILQEVKAGCGKPIFVQFQKEFNFKKISEEFGGLENIKEDLVKGYNLIKDVYDV